MPAVTETSWHIDTLSTGLRLVTVPLPTSQAAVLAAYVGVGSRAERRRTLGLSHYLEHMLFKGTQSRPTAMDISSAIEGAGGSLNAFTTKELTCFWNRVPFEKTALAFDLLSDSLRHSLLEPEEIERERTVVQQEIRRANDEPGQRAYSLLSEIAYGDQPLGWDVAGDVDSVATITRDDLLEHIDVWYGPARLVIAVAGNVDPNAVLELTHRFWDDHQEREAPTPTPADPAMAPQRVAVEHRDIQQCNLAMALRTFPRSDPDRDALSLLNGVLGRGMSSRLFMEVRERRGLAYSVGSGAARFSDAGHLSISAGVTAANVLETTEVILEQLDLLRDALVQPDELDRAREHAIGSFRLGMETAAAWAHRCGESLLMDDEIRTPDEVVAGHRAVTPDDIQRVARRFVRRDNIGISVVGPFDQAAALETMITG